MQQYKLGKSRITVWNDGGVTLLKNGEAIDYKPRTKQALLLTLLAISHGEERG